MAAKKNATSRVRSRRHRIKATMIDLVPDLALYETTGPETIEVAIDDERDRLMKAEAVLHCIEIAMDESKDDNTNAPCYQAAVSVVRDLVAQSINRLDSTRVRPMLVTYLRQGQNGIKECAPKYLH